MTEVKRQFAYKGRTVSVDFIRELIARKKIWPLKFINVDDQELRAVTVPELEGDFAKAGCVPTGRFDNIFCTIVLILTSLQLLLLTYSGISTMAKNFDVGSKAFYLQIASYVTFGVIPLLLLLWFGVLAHRSRKSGFVGVTVLYGVLSSISILNLWLINNANSELLRSGAANRLFIDIGIYLLLGMYSALRWRGLFANPWPKADAD